MFFTFFLLNISTTVSKEAPGACNRSLPENSDSESEKDTHKKKVFQFSQFIQKFNSLVLILNLFRTYLSNIILFRNPPNALKRTADARTLT